MRVPFFLILLIWGLVGCGGQLFLPEPRESREDQPCTVFNPDGFCRDGLECCSGVCDGTCDAWTCSCDPEQACVDGGCVDINSNNRCSESIPEGLCPLGEVCINGNCIPISGLCGCEPPELACVLGECRTIKSGEECSSANPHGLCRDGFACVDGVCIPANNACSSENNICNGLCPSGSTCTGCRCTPIERPCSSLVPDGQCPSCQECVAGVCEQIYCSAEAPACACANADEYCNAGTCEKFPCGPSHLGGFCLDGEFCCATGACINDGGCCATPDCPGGKCSLCTGVGLCIHNDSCVCDDDCQDGNLCAGGDCVRDLRCPDGDDDCAQGEYCDSTTLCRQGGTCGSGDDCILQGLTGTFCSEECGECLLDGKCCKPSDCSDPQFCSSLYNCLDPGACDTREDCQPGFSCSQGTCQPGGASCSGNGGSSCVAAGDDTFWCCPAGVTCCEQGEHCVDTDDNDVLDTCVPDGQCFDDGDCHPSFHCDDYACEPDDPCAAVGECPSGLCSAGGCIPDDGFCASDHDCRTGEVCNALYLCEPAVGCGNQEFEATVVPPNMLIVLDRSGSMNICDVAKTPPSRWSSALTAIDEVIANNQEEIRFGLSTYPHVCSSTDLCDAECCPDNTNGYDCCDNSYSCADSSHCGAGKVDVAVGFTNAGQTAQQTISGSLGTNYPGGNTPTGWSLRNIAAARGSFGLPDPSDPINRDNYIMLLTDGDGNCANNTSLGVCDSYTGEINSINCAAHHMATASPPIRTFVVGFVGGSAGNLNCHAVNGGVSRCPTSAEHCALFATGGETACTASHCSWDGSACGADDNYCAQFTTLGKGACENALPCSWNGSSACVGDPGVCSALTVGGRTACRAAQCFWQSPVCIPLDPDHCDTTTVNCFYRAENAEDLSATFATIAGQIASCSYSLDQIPPEPDALFVYFYHKCEEVTGGETACNLVPGCNWAGSACAGNPARIERDRSRTDNWDYDVVSNQIIFSGNACNIVKGGVVTPVVILGCCEGGEC
ncbi:MAG: hypothetical protein A2341_28335 [Deltaproteobacteria bacterium RIFOXYB12_FULL_58_9]|nr:MAG: hypothetical protein A2341_28335 [Deltaproteobacteria bacterium RIFOXYB12_FULL_58_9]